MKAFTTLTGIAAPLPLSNVDTDKIIPARHLKTIERTGLGKHLFDTLRYNADGSENPEFVLNREPYRHAEVLIAYENFGCGSSREHAPWALLDFGIRCVIAPDFADIFHGNSFKNGILPIKLPREICEQLMDDARLGANARVTIDLERQVVVRPNGEEIPFEVDPLRRHMLLEGLDEIDQTMAHTAAIGTYEAMQASDKPWLAGPGTTALMDTAR
ncbi:3-isopropylmalate/(R)-2-methylmalate dehydratase small subunit [Humitalea rosea]|uniref:3-isopropylmalate dehydratase small subunit n=1 Tax=Humitalea rosea TaxID=990373 RepID=A0A2W7HWW8_9PROT|nr:3-isopropylmalate dehydratase small subunit [Humitalea rosea]PZW37865.1 3-isopropylmalate/(R)-2-methylmalate dehydratase small subunit [Humitalea rosea]